MKTLATAALFLFSQTLGAHPGHGRPGWLHPHDDWLATLALLLWAVVMLGGLGYAAARRLRKRR